MQDNILLLAGETSGDILAASVLEGLQALGNQLPIWGVGGKHLKAAGMECVASIDDLAVRGYSEVLLELPRLWHLRKQLLSQAMLRKPSLCITVDAPDFNLDFALKMKAMGVPTLHFISPSIWAWRAQRMSKIKLAIDHMVCIFSFESILYRQAGVASTYVGHPMAQMIDRSNHQGQSRQKLHLPANKPIVALLPGSREAEIKYVLPRMLQAAQLMLRQQSNIHFVLPVATQSLAKHVASLTDRLRFDNFPLSITQGQASEVLNAADVGCIASGTATLEAALHRLPMVITYAMPWLSYRLMKGKGYLPWVGLPNILAGKTVVPELIQEHATPENLARETLNLLNDSVRCDQIRGVFDDIYTSLLCDTRTLAARAVLRML